MKNYDVIVIGSGSGSIVVDTAAKKGLKCALVEMGKFGGTCLNRGCIPTKILTTVADSIRKMQKIIDIGIEVSSYKIDYDKIGNRVLEKLNEHKDVRAYYKNLENVDVYEGRAKFVSDTKVQVYYSDGQSEIIGSDKIVVAAGARTNIPDLDGLEEAGYLTSESFFGDKFPKKPFESVIIVGGGFIGMEFAHIFAALGTRVTVLQRNVNILPRADEDIIKKAKESFISVGIEILTNCKLFKVEKTGDQKTIHYTDGYTNQNLSVNAQEIMICTGVKSNTDKLDIENTSVQLNDKGYIITNELLQTSSKNIYAIGDINGVYQFKHKANYEAEVLAHNLFNLKNKNYRFVSYEAVPNATFSYPQIASVGMTQKEALDRGFDIKIAKNYYSSTAKGYALGYSKGRILDGFAKIIVEKYSNRILGVHIIGDEAALLLQPYVELMNTGLKYLEPINMQIASNLADEFRANDYTVTNDPETLYSTDNCMVTHPSLAEVSMWTKYMNFKYVSPKKKK